MNTPEGQAILQRLRRQLDGANGDTMTTSFNPQIGKPARDGAGEYAEKAPLGAFTFSHMAGYGLLYQLTGERKYADFGRQCLEKALQGCRDRDNRYSFKDPFGALRAGPSLGWMALGYDLCYDGWDDDFRQKAAAAIAGYNEGEWMSLEELTAGRRQHPGSNHWGMQVGGAAMALLAVMNDPGVDAARINKLLEISQKSMIRNMTEGFGDGGFFAEGDGTGSMASHIVFLSALQAWRTAAGRDFISPRPNAQWMAHKWFFLSIPDGSDDPKKWFWPGRGGYPHNIWDRGGISGGGYFSIAFGISSEAQKAALLWFYNHSGLAKLDQQAGAALDAPSPYPHHSILSFVNWPAGMAQKNPGDVLPRAFRDSKWNFYAWRNRWQDRDDVVITILTRGAKGNMGAAAENRLSILTGGQRITWGNIRGFTAEFAPADDGSTIMTCGDGASLAIDFSKASGADVMLVQAGPSATGDSLDLGGTKVAIFFPARGDKPRPVVQGDRIIVGQQTIGLRDGKIVLGKTAGP
jgi:hypothetical protein